MPYRGGAPLLNALLSNEAQFALDNLAPFLPHIQAGKMRALAVAAPNRLPSLPDVPTFAELGYPCLIRCRGSASPRPPARRPPSCRNCWRRCRPPPARKPRCSRWKERRPAARIAVPQQFTDMMSQRLALYKDLIDRAGIRPE